MKRERIIFGIIASIFVLSVLKTIYAYSMGADTPPFAFAIIFYFIPMAGIVLTALRSDIKLRISKFWTPVGIGVFLVSCFVIYVDFKNDLLYTIFVNSTESVIYGVALGLLLAFIDLKSLNKYAYLLAPTLIFTVIGVAHDDGLFFEHFEVGWNTVVDHFWFGSGILFAWLALAKFRKEKPPLKSCLKGLGIFVGVIVVLLIAGRFVAGFFPENSWQSNWLTGSKPPLAVECVGSDCGLDLYKNIYLSNSSLCVQSHTSFRSGTQSFSMVAQDHELLGCRFVMDTGSKLLTVTCPDEIAPDTGNIAVFSMLECGSGMKNK